jgi:hypothetical protein
MSCNDEEETAKTAKGREAQRRASVPWKRGLVDRFVNGESAPSGVLRSSRQFASFAVNSVIRLLQNRNVLHGSGDPCHALTSPCRAKAGNPGKKRARRVPLHGGHCFLIYPNPPLSGGSGRTLLPLRPFANRKGDWRKPVVGGGRSISRTTVCGIGARADEVVTGWSVKGNATRKWHRFNDALRLLRLAP